MATQYRKSGDIFSFFGNLHMMDRWPPEKLTAKDKRSGRIPSAYNLHRRHIYVKTCLSQIDRKCQNVTDQKTWRWLFEWLAGQPAGSFLVFMFTKRSNNLSILFRKRPNFHNTIAPLPLSPPTIWFLSTFP